MAELKTLSVSKREKTGKGHNRRLRAQQQIPCVFYSPKGKTLSVQAPAKELAKLYEEVGRTTVFNLVYDDDDGARAVSPA